MAIPDRSIRLTLSGLRPTAQRLRRLVAKFAQWGYRSLYLDWNDSFPWSLDERFRRESAFREELVAGLYREAQAEGLAVCTAFPGPDELGFASRLSTFRHLFHGTPDGAILDLTQRAARKFLEDLIDDFLILLPEPGRILLTYPNGIEVASQWGRVCAQAFRARGLSLVHRYCAGADPQSVTEEDWSSSEEIVVPYSSSAASFPRKASRVTWELPVLTASDSNTALALLGRGRTPSERQPSDRVESLLLSFQPDHRCGASQRGIGSNGVLQTSIEPVLHTVRSFAVPGSDVGEDEDESWRPIAEEFQQAIDDGWGCIRRVREEWAAGSISDRLAVGSHSGKLEELNAHRVRAAQLCELLVTRLSPLIELGRLRQELAGSVIALDEEYYLLRSRLATLGT